MVCVQGPDKSFECRFTDPGFQSCVVSAICLKLGNYKFLQPTCPTINHLCMWDSHQADSIVHMCRMPPERVSSPPQLLAVCWDASSWVSTHPHIPQCFLLTYILSHPRSKFILSDLNQSSIPLPPF